MPSGAKKRKAAKKKLQKEAHNTTNNDVSSAQGTDNAKPHDERDSDGGEGEREVSVERDGKEEVRLGDQNSGEYSKEIKSEEYVHDVMVNAEDDVDKSKNGKQKNSSCSSSSSEDEEVRIEKEKPVVAETGELEQQVLSSFSEASRENPVISKVYNWVEEKVPFEESVKQVVSRPHQKNTDSESAAVDNSMISHLVEWKQRLDEVLPSADEKEKFSSRVKDFVQEKIEMKRSKVVDQGVGNLSESVDVAAGDGEGLPESCDLRSADACCEGCEDNQVNETETHKYVEEQPLISSAPLPVRRTSWMNCCGLFEVLSGGASS